MIYVAGFIVLGLILNRIFRPPLPKPRRKKGGDTP
jgi:hypothetical protein